MADPGGATLDDVQALLVTLRDLETAASDAQDEAPILRVAVTAELRAITEELLHDYVENARANEVPWQQIGDVLGISRQAAFQRFRNPNDPRGNHQMRTKTNEGLIPKAEQVYHQLAADDYTAVAAEMTLITQRALSEKKVMGVWNDLGAARSFHTPMTFFSLSARWAVSYTHLTLPTTPYV